MVELCPAQLKTFERLRSIRDSANVFVLEARDGDGGTTLGRALATELGADWVDATSLFATTRESHPLQIEERWCEHIAARLRERRALVVDDFDHAALMLGGCHTYPRSGFLEVGLKALCDEASRRKILEQRLAKSVRERIDVDLDALVATTEGFTGADLRRLVEDGKNLWAHAISNGSEGDPGAHFMVAARDIGSNKQLLEAAATRAHAHFQRASRGVPIEYLRGLYEDDE